MDASITRIGDLVSATVAPEPATAEVIDDPIQALRRRADDRSSMLLGPIVLILAATPMLCGQLSPRGPLGPGPDAKPISDDEWYQTNRVVGAAFLVGGLAWLAAAVLLPGRFDTLRQEHETIALIGVAAIAVATVVSTRYVEGGSDLW